ncbi:MAG: pyridoxal-phosphate dependent enzyme [Rhodobacter sp.]|nr:pyridoxal-phosphate dependent enzyme [Rhodobacter sp.]MCY4166787.1 pyridoxal-phosphate dependent enzyme [Rhodobacter sp.]MCY4243259.1 pyridoxal-phosphate dependent enzyme [Rhodobacter sp.]
MRRCIENTIGGTPIVKLTNLDIPDGIRIFAKLEFLNLGKCIEDTMVQYVLADAEREELLSIGSTIVENTSGNTGAGEGKTGGSIMKIGLPSTGSPDESI